MFSPTGQNTHFDRGVVRSSSTAMSSCIWPTLPNRNSRSPFFGAIMNCIGSVMGAGLITRLANYSGEMQRVMSGLHVKVVRSMQQCATWYGQSIWFSGKLYLFYPRPLGVGTIAQRQESTGGASTLQLQLQYPKVSAARRVFATEAHLRDFELKSVYCQYFCTYYFVVMALSHDHKGQPWTINAHNKPRMHICTLISFNGAYLHHNISL